MDAFLNQKEIKYINLTTANNTIREKINKTEGKENKIIEET